LVNETKRLIYLDHPRTASTSTTEYLAKRFGFYKYETKKGQHGTQHRVRPEVNLMYPWGAYYKFTTVREHHDLVASWMVHRGNNQDPPSTPWAVRDVEEALQYPYEQGWMEFDRAFPMLDHAHVALRFSLIGLELDEFLSSMGFDTHQHIGDRLPHRHSEWKKKRPEGELLEMFEPTAWRYINDRFHWERSLILDKSFPNLHTQTDTRCHCGRRI
jgi:hypothetical protein